MGKRAVEMDVRINESWEKGAAGSVDDLIIRELGDEFSRWCYVRDDPIKNPAFATLFEEEWVADLRGRLSVSVNALLQKAPTPRLLRVF